MVEIFRMKYLPWPRNKRRRHIVCTQIGKSVEREMGTHHTRCARSPLPIAAINDPNKRIVNESLVQRDTSRTNRIISFAGAVYAVHPISIIQSYYFIIRPFVFCFFCCSSVWCNKRMAYLLIRLLTQFNSMRVCVSI